MEIIGTKKKKEKEQNFAFSIVKQTVSSHSKRLPFKTKKPHTHNFTIVSPDLRCSQTNYRTSTLKEKVRYGSRFVSYCSLLGNHYF